MDNRKKLEQEREELNAMIGKGVTFDVKDVTFDVKKRFFGFLKKRTPKEVTRRFTIHEPTLATLDRLSAEWIELAIDDDAMKSNNGMQIARTMAHNQSIRCAKVVAIAVLGEDRLIPQPGKCGTRWVEDTKRLDELTNLFARTVKPSKLYQLVVLINTMCNLGDFLNSIRLMSTERTTMPNRIEEDNVG